MSLVNVLIENWPRLQCVNICLTFDSEAPVHQAQLQLTPTHLNVSFGHQTTAIPFPPSLCVNVDTISQLVKDSNYLSFRLCTNRAQAFDEEYLCQQMPSARINGPSRMKLHPSVKQDERVQLACTFCGLALSDVVAFQRVLELPSDNLDLDEWFCHHPSKGHSHGADAQELGELVLDGDSAIKSNFTKMNARPLDLLYGQFFFVVSVERLAGMQLERNSVKCPQCYRELGERHRKNDTVKLWNELVSFKAGGGDQSQTTSTNSMKSLFAGTLFDQFLFIVRKVIEDFDFLWSTDALPQTTRCLFETSRASGQRSFLLINVMAKELEMWLSETNNEPDRLQPVKGMKVLFQVIDNDCAAPVPPLIASWLDDSTVNHIRISVAMMADAVAGLEERVLLMPKCYRHAFGWGFCMSYLYETKSRESVSK